MAAGSSEESRSRGSSGTGGEQPAHGLAEASGRPGRSVP